MSAWAELASAGVLGINRRNVEYIAKYNDRHLYPLVDDKLKTKLLAHSAQIAVPELYGVVSSPGQVKDLPRLLNGRTDFVIKPASGSGGQGVIVITGSMKAMYREISGRLISEDQLKYHALNIISGMYSLGGRTDKAILEYRVRFDSVFDQISFLGVPDIRIIVFIGVPVMAMVRLPTRMSQGKANLHQGAIGAGIDLSSGKTLTAVWKDMIIDEHPDTLHSVVGISIPRWDELLTLAARCYELTGLGYQGIDIVLDKDLGPLILELNARPGLNIQIANHAGLANRLAMVEQAREGLTTIQARVAFAKGCFGYNRDQRGEPSDS